MSPIKARPKGRQRLEYDWISPTGRPAKPSAPQSGKPSQAPTVVRKELTTCMRVVRVAERLDISKKRVYQLVREGRLEAVRFGPRMMRILTPSLERYVAERKRAEAEREP
jgi:excisionase family DNA binding protein